MHLLHPNCVISLYKYNPTVSVVSDLGLLLAEIWQSEGRLWVDEMMVDVSLGGHKHQATANAR